MYFLGVVMSENNLPKTIRVSKVSTLKNGSDTTHVYVMERSGPVIKRIGRFGVEVVQSIVGLLVFVFVITLSFGYAGILQSVPIYLAFKLFSNSTTATATVPETEKVWEDHNMIHFQVQQELCNKPLKSLREAVAKRSYDELIVALKANKVSITFDELLENHMKDDSPFILFVRHVTPTETEYFASSTEHEKKSCRVTFSISRKDYRSIIGQISDDIVLKVTDSKFSPEL